MMKVGLLVESGRAGLEAIVFRRICDLLIAQHEAQIEVEIVPMDNKLRLLQDCAGVAKALLATGFERVVVLWDERPAWPTANDRLCWHNDREHALAQLNALKVPLEKVHLVCIEREFESWLMYDHRMLGRVLSRQTRTVSFPKQSHPDRNPNPKGTLTSKFRELAGQTYVDVNFATRFAIELSSLNKVLKCPTFKRFAVKLTGQEF